MELMVLISKIIAVIFFVANIVAVFESKDTLTEIKRLVWAILFFLIILASYVV